MTFDHTIELVGRGVEVIGVGFIVAGVLGALAVFLTTARRAPRTLEAYRKARPDVGRSILFGLEVLVAGDIVRTVAVDPTFRSVAVLAAVVLIRTFLSFTLEQIDGRWARQTHRGDPVRT